MATREMVVAPRRYGHDRPRVPRLGKYSRRRVAVNRVMRRWIRRILIGMGVLLLLVLATILSIPAIFAPERRAAADVILHLASDARLQGDEYVVRLYREGLSRNVICASSPASIRS